MRRSYEMTGTLLAFAFVTIAAEAVLSNGATTRMQAPLDSAESACVCWVVAFPCALVTSTVAPGRYCWIAATTSGWSAASHRAAVALSGRRKATCLQFLPLAMLSLVLPQAASALTRTALPMPATTSVRHRRLSISLMSQVAPFLSYVEVTVL